MNRFAFALGQRAASRRHSTGEEQVEPPLPAASVEDWRRGYGGSGKPCPSKTTVAVTAQASAASPPIRLPVPRHSRTGSVPVATGAVNATKPRTLFEIEQEPEKTREPKSVKPKPPMPVPLDEIQHEIDLLVRIGIGLSEADDLVRKQQWTLDQMVCQWQLGNEAGLPQHVIGCVARYGQSRWSTK